ncbi:MAG: phosphopantetheine-binding protein, partial [Acidobacteriota bacterium]
QVPGIRILLFEDDELPIRREWPSWLGDPSSPDRRELGESLAQQGHSAPFAARSNLVSEIAGKAEALAAETPIASLPADFDETVDALCAAYAYRCLADRFDLEGIGEISLDELGQRLEVDSRHAKLFAYLLRILAEDGLADSTQDGIRFNPLPDHLASPERMARDLAERFPAFRVGFDCLAHCAAHYPQILRGEVDPIAVLYPDGSGQMLADVMAAQAKYSTSQRYQRTIVEVLRGLAAETGSRPLRILELAGGEGGLTWELAEALQDLEVEYHFSDAGRSFVLAARREAARRGFDGMRFHGLEIAGDLAAQGFEQFGFDVVVGVDAVHTTARVSATLEWAGELLAPGGAMLLVEPTRNQRWVSLIWGLLDDWWRFSDSELRLHSPIVEPRALEEVLGQLSFAETAVLPTDATARSVADHSLLVLRQPMEPHTPEREAWAESLWRQQREQVGRRIRCVSELEELGAEVRWLVAKGQVSEMAEDIAQAATGPLRGVIHALPGATEESSAEAARRDLDPLAYRLSVETLRARLEGLGKALGQQAPPHALLVSGLAAAAGAVGAGPAAASDRFAERLAMNSSEAEGGLRWRSLVWGLADDRKTPLKMKAAALAHALTTFEPRLVLSRQPDSEMAIAWNRPRRRSAGDADLSLALTPSSGDGLVAPRDADERTVAEIWREVLGVERLDVRDPFFDLGGDSLIATQLHSRLRDAFGLDLPMAKLFEEPTIEGQARAVTEARNEQEGRQQEKLLGLLAQMSDEEAEAELARMLGEPAVVRDPQVEIETTS